MSCISPPRDNFAELHHPHDKKECAQSLEADAVRVRGIQETWRHVYAFV